MMTRPRGHRRTCCPMAADTRPPLVAPPTSPLHLALVPAGCCSREMHTLFLYSSCGRRTLPPLPHRCCRAVLSFGKLQPLRAFVGEEQTSTCSAVFSLPPSSMLHNHDLAPRGYLQRCLSSSRTVFTGFCVLLVRIIGHEEVRNFFLASIFRESNLFIPWHGDSYSISIGRNHILKQHLLYLLYLRMCGMKYE